MRSVVPIRFADAARLVAEWHRHHRPPKGHKFSIGLAEGEEVVGAIIVGRPVARAFDDGLTLEVTRCVVADGIPNGCSQLYGAAWRAAKALGYTRLITYTREDEGGASLRAAGWTVVAQRPARAGWHAPSRPRINDSTEHYVQRTLWEAS